LRLRHPDAPMILNINDLSKCPGNPITSQLMGLDLIKSLILKWWPETGSFFPRGCAIRKLQKTKHRKIPKCHLSRIGGTNLVQRPLGKTNLALAIDACTNSVPWDRKDLLFLRNRPCSRDECNDDLSPIEPYEATRTKRVSS